MTTKGKKKVHYKTLASRVDSEIYQLFRDLAFDRRMYPSHLLRNMILNELADAGKIQRDEVEKA